MAIGIFVEELGIDEKMASRSSIEIYVPECDCQWPVLSNEFVLTLSISLFLIFAVAELFGALASDSLSLLGDSICMFVDVTSYICSTYVEWYKARRGRVTFGSRIFTEIIVPTLSILSLMAVTVYITMESMEVVRNPSTKNSVNVSYLYSYSLGNLIVDIICNFLFFLKGQDAFVEDTVDIPKLSLDTSIDFDDEVEFGLLDDNQLICDGHNDRFIDTVNDENNNSFRSVIYRFFIFYCCGLCSTVCHWSDVSSYEHNHQHDHYRHHHPGHSRVHKSNLNMLSAFSHLLGDTFRTLSTFIAAVVSTTTGIDGEICDAWSAIAVSITIVIMCTLLLWEIKDAAIEIWDEDCTDANDDNIHRHRSLCSPRTVSLTLQPLKISRSKQTSQSILIDSSTTAVSAARGKQKEQHNYQRLTDNDNDDIAEEQQ